jgi:hypothetical protein
MSRLVLVTVIAASVLGLGAFRTVLVPWRRALTFNRFEQPARVDLAGLASIQLPPSFKPVGRGWDGPRDGHWDPKSLDQHRDDYQITFRFEQGQHHVLGGHLADPVLLHVTLFNPTANPPDASKITFTTIPRFYPPVNDDWPRFDAHFKAQRWLPDVKTGEAVTRAAATGEGRGDNVVSGPPERWLVIHVDPVRRIRVDLYTWRKAYSVDDARALVRRVAESVQVTPKLAELLDGAKGADKREEAKFEKTVTDALAALNRCGIQSIGPEMVAWSDRCAAWLSADRRDLRIARAVGRIPLAAATGRWQDAPEFKVTMPEGRAPALMGPPDFRMTMFHWDATRNRWAIAGFGEHLFGDDDEAANKLLPVIAARLTDRASVHLLALANYDLMFHPDRVAVEAFLAESDRVSAALREGKVVAGVKAEAFAFSR